MQLRRHPAIDSRDSAELRRVLAPLLARCRGRMILFGSRARGDARRTSDIDLALRASQAIPAHWLAEAREAIDESLVPFRVDLIDYATAPPALKNAIDIDGYPMARVSHRLDTARRALATLDELADQIFAALPAYRRLLRTWIERLSAA